MNLDKTRFLYLLDLVHQVNNKHPELCAEITASKDHDNIFICFFDMVTPCESYSTYSPTGMDMDVKLVKAEARLKELLGGTE